MDKICEFCGNTFITKDRNRPNRFCSKICYFTFKHEFAITHFIDRFWSKVLKTDNCWIWTGADNGHGYGTISRPTECKRTYAHRISWELVHGAIPHGLQVLHHCDNPPCVRPDHLFLGTRSDNMCDMVAKGRHRLQVHPEYTRGERGPSAKLKESQVIEIRQLRINGAGVTSLVERFGMSKTQIYRILSRESWAHI